ncbi:hypothetical protein HMI55_006754 [Coelomomyces lativittatus]|nr:hypothetical protein HMI55_006754 [Coelomomyces lativittatus]
MKTSMEPFEWNHVGRLSDVLHSNCLVMLVTHPTDPLLPLALHYLERSSRSPTALNHVRIVHPECRSPPLPSHSPLAFAFQMSLASLHACQAWVLQHPHSTPIYVPWVPSHFDTRNASQCHAAMSPVWTRETLATVCFSHLPSVHCSASPLTPTSSIFHDFATLLLTHPHQTHWQWTLAHELPPRSTLQVSVAQLKSKKKKWPTDVHALLSFLESIQHDRQAFPVPLANYFQLFTRFGGRIEAVFKASF